MGAVAVAPDRGPHHGHLRPVARGTHVDGSTPGRPTAAVSSVNGFTASGVTARSGRYGNLFRPRQRLRPVLAAHPPPTDRPGSRADRPAGVQRRLPTGTPTPIPQRGRRCPTGWDWLTRDRGPGARANIIAGDSAGGHLAVDLLLQPDVAHPSALALLSPVLDLTFTLARTRERITPGSGNPFQRRCPASRVVLRGNRFHHPRLKLDVATGRTLPPRGIKRFTPTLYTRAVGLTTRVTTH